MVPSAGSLRKCDVKRLSWRVVSNIYRHLDLCEFFSDSDRLQTKFLSCYPIWRRLALNGISPPNDQLQVLPSYVSLYKPVCGVWSIPGMIHGYWPIDWKAGERQHCVFLFNLWLHMRFSCCNVTEQPCKTPSSQQVATVLLQKRLIDNLEDKNFILFYVAKTQT